MPKTNNTDSKLTRKWLIVPLLAAILIALIAVVAIPDEYLHVSFLNVGQGDAILISQGSQQILVDGGPSPQQLNLELSRKMAIISVGADNKFGQPSPELLTLLEKRLGAGSIYRTDKQGTIEFTTDGERLWVKSDTQS